MKLSVCVDAVYDGKDFIDSMRSVRGCGIDSIEFWCWWDKDIDAVNSARKELGLTIAAFCTKFISLTDPAQREDYIAGLVETLAVAQKLDCKTIITQVGEDRKDVPAAEQHKSIVEGLKACVPYLEKAGVTLVFEPLNTKIDHMGYYLWSSDEGADIVDEVGSPYVKMLFDLYHQQIMEGDIIRRSTQYLDKIGHMHAAGNPGRHELDDGEINYKGVFDALKAAGYKGHVGLEYFPVQAPETGLNQWAVRY